MNKTHYVGRGSHALRAYQDFFARSGVRAVASGVYFQVAVPNCTTIRESDWHRDYAAAFQQAMERAGRGMDQSWYEDARGNKSDFPRRPPLWLVTEGIEVRVTDALPITQGTKPRERQPVSPAKV